LVQTGKEQARKRRRRKAIGRGEKKNAYTHRKIYHGEPMSIKLNSKMN